jgi:DNA-binding NarL/FixJ family response regulator
LGAVCWAQRAERELAGFGQRIEASRAPALAALTPKEYQVAALVAQGTTNREAANSLFLSTRTVEAHLASVFRKLGIKSRSQLVRALSENRETHR